MRFVITGGAGFLGSHLCERILGDGHEVICIDNYLTGRLDNVGHLLPCRRFHIVDRDVTEYVHISDPVDTVMHFASPASPVDYYQHPVETLKVGALGTLHMLELARKNGARFLLASTSETYGDPQVNPQPETYWGNVNSVGPRSAYDEAKRYAEALTTAFRYKNGVDTGIVRIFNTYGPRMRTDDGRAIPTFISQALMGQPLTVSGDGSQTRSICYIDDLVEGILRMNYTDLPGPINIGNANEITILKTAKLVRELCGADVPISFVRRPEDDPTVRRPDITLAHNQLGWEPKIDMIDGLIRTIKWFALGPCAAWRTGTVTRNPTKWAGV